MSQLTFDNEKMTLQKALKEIHFYKGIVPIKAYEVLSNHQEEVTPSLIQILKNVIQSHDCTGDYYVAHIHALLLLSQFREKKTYPLVIELLNLPIDSIDRLLGDMFTETVPKIIISVYDGDPEPLFDLLTNHEIDNTLRSVIGGCFSALIYQKMIDKNMFLLRMQKVVASGEMNQDKGFYTVLANLTVDNKLDPLYDPIRAAFKMDLVFNNVIDSKFFEEGLSRPIEELVGVEYLNPLQDAAKELAKWYSKDKPIMPKIDRNASCPCGSGLKFKKCCINLL